ncbi:MAG: hypothetical protein AAF757_16675 [Cyanobacteria bacterium P01_D01_bin.116]
MKQAFMMVMPVYWSTRMGTHPEVPKKTAKLLKKQKGKCTHCGLHFKPDDVWEIDHVNPKARMRSECIQQPAIITSSLPPPKNQI